MSRTRTYGVGLLLAAGTAIVLWSSCSGARKGPEHATSEAATEPESAPATTATSAAVNGASAMATGGAAGGAPHDSAAGKPPASHADAGSAPPERSGSSIVRAVGTSDPRDLAFLSRIEREPGKDPPPEVHALVERRKRGATREELMRGARELSDLRLRVLALRWVDDVFGTTSAGAAPAAPASGSAPPLVKPLAPKR